MIEYFRKHKGLRWLAILCVLIALAYGSGRLYFQLTGGFLVSNITSDLAYDARWEVAALPEDDASALDRILKQPYRYLGKGCQSYVFVSEDQQYVIKFFKYQRFRPQEWLNYFSFIPTVDQYRLDKIAKKKKKLEDVFTSWKIAYDYLKPETGVVFVHLNKQKMFDHELVIYDKLGFEHAVNINETEFLVQKKAEMLCPTLTALVEKGEQKNAEKILSELVQMLVYENSRGFADNDHALMQNTGVIDMLPVHIDVGQFIRNPIVKDPAIYHQEIFNKTYKFRKWLEATHPALAKSLENQLTQVIGEEFWSMKPVFYTADMARIPNSSP